MVQYYGNSRRFSPATRKKSYQNQFFTQQVWKEHNGLPVEETTTEHAERWRTAALVADHVESYFYDLLSLANYNSKSVTGCAIRMAKKIGRFDQDVQDEIQRLCVQYVDDLDSEISRAPSLNVDAQKLLIRQWLTVYFNQKKLRAD